MGETSIEWTANEDGTPGKTWNPLRGCTEVSPGCAHCYAGGIAARFSKPGQPYEGLAYFDAHHKAHWTGKVRTVPQKLAEPLKWRKPAKVFVNSMSDLFHEDVPDDYIDQVFDVMWKTPQHTYQVLTKRADRLVDYIRSRASRRSFGWTDMERYPMKPGDFVSFDTLYYRNQCGFQGDESWACDHPSKGSYRGKENSCDECECPVASSVSDRKSLRRIGVEHEHEFDDEGYTEDVSGWMEMEGRPLHAACGNVWLGFSAENQEQYEKRFRQFRPLRWILGPYFTLFASLEPLLGPIDFRLKYWPDSEDRIDDGLQHSALEPYRFQHAGKDYLVPYLNWVIVGGESGPRARPFDLAWARSIRDQCKMARVPFFFKQAGSRPVGQWGESMPSYGPIQLNPGYASEPVDYWRLKDSHGGDWDEWPDDLRVRQFPAPIQPAA